MGFPWWDDAVAWALHLAKGTALKHTVKRSPDTGLWVVGLADQEPCS